MTIKLKTLCLIILGTLCLLTLTGCSQDSNPSVERFYYVIAIGLDTSENYNLQLSVQIATSSSSDESSDSAQSSTSTIYTVDCNSIPSGISIFNNYLSKELNFSHCSALVFSEELAKEGISDYITTLSSNTEIRPTASVIISNKTSKAVLESISESSEQFSAKLYEFIINSNEYTGYSIDSNINEFFYKLYSPNTCPIATYIDVTDNILQNIGVAVFEDGKFSYSLTVLDAISYLIITNNLSSCVLSIPNPTDSTKLIDVSVSLKKDSNIKVELINNHPYIEIEAFLEYSVQNSNSNLNLENSDSEAVLKNEINTYVKSLMQSFLYKTSHEHNTDICDFQNILTSSYLTYEEFENVHWNEIYKDSYFTINLNSSIYISELFSQH